MSERGGSHEKTHTNEEIRKEKKKQRGGGKEGNEGKETEKNNGCTLSFYTIGYLGDLLDGWPEKVHLEVTFSKMRLHDATKLKRLVN